MAQHCIHVRSTTEGPALGVTAGDRSQLCGVVTIYTETMEPVATVTAEPDGVQVTLHAGTVALTG